ncbi:hypothetical protein [uncultured Roseobacter sp.]|uniref:hypothetical protein n=1 Tax=uncultured Roseobacter sp. TaxID=114847 RepID=UPI00260B6D1C|nr:hypothetical protein [uncultured Roseobacter sp.]
MVGLAPTFRDFVAETERSVFSECKLDGRSVETEPLLNGAPYQIFRQSTEVERRRTAGTFFTGSANAWKIAHQLHETIPADSLVMDPTCGIGDLLLAYADHLPVEETLQQTLTNWGTQLSGLDLDAELVRLAKARLVLSARLRGGFIDEIGNINELFPQIRVGDMMTAKRMLKKPDGFLFNPPFGVVKEVADCSWSAGSVNSAALFLAELVTQKGSIAPISAILPEVLRCGSRYEAFRNQLERWGFWGSYQSLGRFDSWTDVDVFSTLIVPSPGKRIWNSGDEGRKGQCVGDKFDVRVGTVVPHRHPKKGPWHRYICAKSTPRWCDGFAPKSNRRFEGTVFEPPFVVVRRTSSPNDRYRAVATAIVGDRPVAVENHLLVLLPKDGGLESCRQLVRLMGADETNLFLNTRIRCRHLTTGVVAQIPWLEPND